MEETTLQIKNISPRYSMQGWQLKHWLAGNGEAVKVLLAAAAALYTPINPAFKIIMGAGVKLALDSLDYFVSEVKIK